MNKLNPLYLYPIVAGCVAVLNSMIFTANSLSQATVAQLTSLQLVRKETASETAVGEV